jgi:chitin synthase
MKRDSQDLLEAKASSAVFVLDKTTQTLPDASRTNTEILVCVTLYNESVEMFSRTYKGLVENALHISREKGNKFLGRCKICILADGNETLSEGIYDEAIKLGLINRHRIDSIDGNMTVYQSKMDLESSEVDCRPTVYFGIKHKNRGKLDTHWWFFNKFAKPLNPSLCVQLDVGTIPSENSIIDMWDTIQTDPTVGAIATRVEIRHDKSKNNLLYAFQHGEFMFQKTLYWAAEFHLGYLTVIPGQLCGINWQALSKHPEGTPSPLDIYLSGLDAETPFETTMYLAEDRVMGFELMSSPGQDYRSHYLADAAAISDDCLTLDELLKQRKRWINSAFATRLFMQMNLGRYWKQSSSSLFRKTLTSLAGFSIVLFENLLEFFLPVITFLILAMGFDSFAILAEKIGIFSYFLYAALAGLWLLPSLAVLSGFHRRISNSAVQYMLFGSAVSCFIIILAAPVANTISLTEGINIWWFLSFAFPLIGLLNALTIDYAFFKRYASSFAQYLFLSLPVHLMLSVYAIINLHDASWGTKGLKTVQLGSNHGAQRDRRTSLFMKFRSRVIGVYLLANGLLIAICLLPQSLLGQYVGKGLVVWSCFIAIAASSGLVRARIQKVQALKGTLRVLRPSGQTAAVRPRQRLQSSTPTRT